MRRRNMQAEACAHQRAKSCEATLCSKKTFDCYKIIIESEEAGGKKDE